MGSALPLYARVIERIIGASASAVAVPIRRPCPQIESAAFGCGLLAVGIVYRVGKLALLVRIDHSVAAGWVICVLACAVAQAGVYSVGIAIIAIRILVTSSSALAFHAVGVLGWREAYHRAGCAGARFLAGIDRRLVHGD